MTKGRLAAVAALVAFASVGCATGRATVESRKREGYDRRFEKTLVLFEHDRLGQDFMQAFKESFAKELGQRGAEVRYAVVGGKLAVDAPPNLETQAKAFGANTVLLLRQAGGTVNQYGGMVLARLDVGAHDLALGKQVWRANVEYTPGHQSVAVTHRADILVYELVVALVSDGLIRGPLPAKPEPPEPPRQPTTDLAR